MESDRGKELRIIDKLKLCVGIGSGIMAMHSCSKFQAYSEKPN
jgi:hypothetical protein